MGKLKEGREREEVGEFTFGDIASLILAEPCEVFVFHPGDPGFVLRVVLFFCPLHFEKLSGIECCFGRMFVCLQLTDREDQRGQQWCTSN
jgi:hypothetical protein